METGLFHRMTSRRNPPRTQLDTLRINNLTEVTEPTAHIPFVTGLYNTS